MTIERAASSTESPSPTGAVYPGAERLLEELIEPVVATMGFELVQVRWHAGKRRQLRVYIDHERGVTVDDCAKISRIVSNELDTAEQTDGPRYSALLAAPYTLEVSSPGLDRPLARLSHFRRFVGRRAKLRTRTPLPGDDARRNFVGEIVGVEPAPGQPDDDRAGLVLLRIDDGDLHRIALADIRQANLVFEG